VKSERSLQAIVFDFDGVIANSEPLHFSAFRDVLSAERVTLTESDYYDRYLGYDDVGVFRAVAKDRGLTWTEHQIAALVDKKAGRMEALERDTTVIFPGAEAVIRRAAAAVPLAIASGALAIEIRRILDRAELTGCFQAIVSAEDTPLSKPAPDPYVRAVALLSARLGETIEPRCCVAIEDSHWGLKSAKTAGLKTVGVAQTYDRASLEEADLVVSTVADVDVAALARLIAD
jgi:HAD superfamily hydrolase (TIGR01509 family)